MIQHRETPTTRIPSEAENTVEAIQLWLSLEYEIPTIARRLHLKESDVRHVIRSGRLPPRQLELWKDVPQ